MTEHVYMVWDIYDGVRSGIADYAGKPHYFNCVFDKDACDHTNEFELTPVDSELLKLAKEQWGIYRAWERRFHSGSEELDTHPGHRGTDPRYDELDEQIKTKLQSLSPTRTVGARFTAKDDQRERPDGCLLEMEVEWR